MSVNAELALWIIAACLVVQTVLAIRTSIVSGKSLKRLEAFPNRDPERQRIRQIIEEGHYGEALAMALARQKTKPGDPYSWYDAGLCYYHMKDWKKAMSQFEAAQNLAPSWEEKWTGPYIQIIQQQLKADKP